MRGEEKTLTEMLKKEDSFIIPVYQRDYNWGKDQCRQLYDDLILTITHNRPSHFFGSIVDARDPNGGKYESIIIDGQQRITTVSILLVAFTAAINKDELRFVRKERDELLRDIMDLLKARDRIKLKPAPNSRAAYNALFGPEDDFVKDSNVTENYNYFVKRIQEDKENITADDFWNAVDNLAIIDISLGSEDDAQLIFESINSTGMALSESDKIRNYVMMGLNLKEQERFYNDYWKKIETNTEWRSDYFIRDFLTIQTREVPNRDRIYEAFKAYARTLDGEHLLATMLKFSKYYASLYHPETAEEKFRSALVTFRKLDLGVADPYLMQVFDGYYSNSIPENEVNEALDVIEDYLFRRKICDVPTNALNKIFKTLHTDAIKLKGNTDDYSERIKYILMKKDWSGRFPRDEEFVEKLRNRDIYTSMVEKYKVYLLERLENFDNNESHNIEQLINEGKCSIEHIMPQTLTDAWIAELGGEETAKRVHEQWLHKLGNLTFTGYNSKYSNLPFETKLNMEHGFKDSTFSLNKYIRECTQWNEATIIERTNILIEKALRIWQTPESEFIEDVVEDGGTINLAEKYNFSGRAIRGFTFEKISYDVSSWKEFMVQMMQLLYEKNKEPLVNLSRTTSAFGPSNYITASEHDFDRWKLTEIKDGIYLFTNTSTWDKIKLLTSILDIYEIPHSSVEIKIKEGKTANPGIHDNAYRFWEQNLDEIKEKTGLYQRHKPSSSCWITNGAGVGGGMQYLLYFNNTRCIVAFEFNSHDVDENIRFYDYVDGQKAYINAEFGKPLTWSRNADKRRSYIEIASNDFSLDDENTWEDAVGFMVENLSTLKRILQPILESYHT